MRYCLRGVMLLAVACCGAAPVQAQWLGGVAEHTKQVWRNNNNWPRPFVFADRASVAQPMLIMVNNGWKRQNLLCDYHFEEDTGRLTSAGVLKVRSILGQTNPDRRTIYVQRAVRPDLTAARLETVQQTALRLLPPGTAPQIAQTDMDDPGRPAEDVDNINVQFSGSAPVPRLPAKSNMASSGSSGSGGSMSSSGSGSGGSSGASR